MCGQEVVLTQSWPVNQRLVLVIVITSKSALVCFSMVFVAVVFESQVARVEKGQLAN
jgi:hypothetical protein